MPQGAMMALLLALALSSAQASSGGVTIGDRTFSHTWSTKASMPMARSDMTATTVGDSIFLIGGCIMDQIWTHHPAYPSYECGSGLASAVTSRTTAFLPGSNRHVTDYPDAPRARFRHAATAVNGKIYLFGGVNGTGNIVPQVDVFDTSSKSWTSLSNHMPSPATDLAVFAHGGKIYVLGGYTANWEALTTMYIFDPALTGAAAWTQGPSLKQGRGDTFAAVIDDSAFVVGGFHHANNFEFPLKSIERFDVGSNGAAWDVRKEMEVARGDKAVAALHGVLHVIGGETKTSDGHSQPLRDVEVYDPQSNAWYSGGDIPSERFRFTAAAHNESIFIFGGQGFLVGGYGTADSKYPVLATVEEYSEKVVTDQSLVNNARGAQENPFRGFLSLVAVGSAAVACSRM